MSGGLILSGAYNFKIRRH